MVKLIFIYLPYLPLTISISAKLTSIKISQILKIYYEFYCASKSISYFYDIVIKMETTKNKSFTEKQYNIALMAKALGHPARVAIIEHLMEINACIVSDILEEIPLAQATVSQHLKVLREADLIKGTIEGNAICYCINEKTFETFNNYISKMNFNVNKQECC